MLKEIFFSYEINYDIIEGCDGIDILKHIIEDQKNRNLIKCIFTDECMEYMNGSQSIEIIRQMEIHNKIKNLKIVSITSFEDEYNKEIILSKGADYIIDKPCTKTSMLRVLNELNILS